MSTESDSVSVLVVDDEPDWLEAVMEYFDMHGFKTFGVEDGEAMRNVMAVERIDVVLLDKRLRGEDGFDLCQELRKGPPVGIIMLTGSADVSDKVVGLELGADDYVAKPCEMRELLARVRVLHRRLSQSKSSFEKSEEKPEKTTTFTFGNYILNLANQSLHTKDGQPVALTSMEFELLRVLAENPNKVMSRDQILDQTYHRDAEPFDRSIDVRIVRLRRKLERNPTEPKFIRTVRGAGYVFCP